MAISETKALKEVVVLRIRLQSHQVHLTMLQYYTVHMHAIYRETDPGLNFKPDRTRPDPTRLTRSLNVLKKQTPSSKLRFIACNIAALILDDKTLSKHIRSYILLMRENSMPPP